MGKKLTLLCIFLMMVGSFVGYVYLTEKTTAGGLKIAEGEKQIEQGEQMLAKGKAKLSSGQQRLTQAKKDYKSIKTVSYLSVAAVPLAGGLLAVTNKQFLGGKIAEGNRLVAKGENKIKAGEEQLNAGKEALRLGKEKLALANKIRMTCGIGALICAALLSVLGFFWRQKSRRR
jgi:hypothetical protein